MKRKESIVKAEFDVCQLILVYLADASRGYLLPFFSQRNAEYYFLGGRQRWTTRCSGAKHKEVREKDSWIACRDWGAGTRNFYVLLQICVLFSVQVRLWKKMKAFIKLYWIINRRQ